MRLPGGHPRPQSRVKAARDVFLGRAARRRAALSLSLAPVEAASASLGPTRQEGRMSIVNRRNAVVGWLVLKTGKVVARRKAKRVGSKLASWRSRKSD